MQILTLLRTPNLRARSRVFNDVKSFVRLHFLYDAWSLGLLQVLKDAPASKDELTKRLSVQRPELLESLLDLGVALNELSLNAHGFYRITGRVSYALSSDREDPLAASVEEYVTLHSSVFQNLSSRIRGGPLGDYLKNIGPLIARSSRIVEPYIRDFVIDTFKDMEPRNVLELGCGSGIYLRHAAEASPQLIGFGVELDDIVAKQAAANLKEWRISDRFKILAADARKLPAELAGPFDLVTLYNNIYYFAVEERVSLFRDLRSRLAPKGALAIVSLMQGKSVTSADFDLVLKSTLGCAPLPEANRTKRQLIEAGFENVKMRKLIPFESYYGITATM